MATIDDQIQLANQIAEEIVREIMSLPKKEKDKRDLIKASRNEWMKWLQVVKAKGLDRAIAYARQLSKDVTVRQNIQTIYDQFAKSVSRHKAQLSQSILEEQWLSLGYVAWWLRILAAESQYSAAGPKEDTKETGARKSSLK